MATSIPTSSIVVRSSSVVLMPNPITTQSLSPTSSVGSLTEKHVSIKVPISDAAKVTSDMASKNHSIINQILPEPIDKEQTLKDIFKEKEHLMIENLLLADHLMRVSYLNTTESEEESQSSHTNENDEEILDYGSSNSLDQAQNSLMEKDFMQEAMRQGSSFVGELTHEEYNLGNFPLPKLNAEEKNEIASKENAGLHEEMDICRSTNERMLDELRAAYDESELRIGEVRRDRADFQRDVMSDAQNKGFKRANAHKVLKFLEAKIKYKVAKAKKVAQRNQALQVVITRTDKQLAMKKELADVLHAVDFEQLHIHKQQNQQRLHDKNHELQQLKSSHIKASECLESNLSKLTDLINKRSQTLEDLSQREPQLAHVKKDIERVSTKKERLEELFHTFVQERDAQLGESQPNVLDYMQLKDKVHSIRQEYKTWTQKVEVAELRSHGSTHQSPHQSEKDTQSRE